MFSDCMFLRRFLNYQRWLLGNGGGLTQRGITPEVAQSRSFGEAVNLVTLLRKQKLARKRADWHAPEPREDQCYGGHSRPIFLGWNLCCFGWFEAL
jgi:hypothetical protein